MRVGKGNPGLLKQGEACTSMNGRSELRSGERWMDVGNGGGVGGCEVGSWSMYNSGS